MKRKPLPRNEQETIIQRYRDSNTWHVYTCDELVKKRLKPIMDALSISWTKIDEHGVEVEIPESCVRLYKPILVSDEERARRSKMGKASMDRIHSKERL